MAGARLEIYDNTGTTIQDFNDFGDVNLGEESGEYEFLIKNIGSDTATSIYLFARTNNNLYSGQTNANGQEAITEKWVEVDTGSGFTAIGGDFGNQGAPANAISISNLSAGSSTAVFKVKFNIPLVAQTNGTFRVALGVSYAGY